MLILKMGSAFLFLESFLRFFPLKNFPVLCRRQAVKIMLTATRVVIIYEVIDRLYQLLFALKLPEVIHLTFEDSPEAFHRSVVNAASNSRHALCHSGFVQFSPECFARVLVSSVAVEQRFGIGVLVSRLFKICQDEGVVIALAYGVRDDVSCLEVEDRTQIQFFCIVLVAAEVLHFCDVCQPYAVGCSVGSEFSVQDVFRCDLGCTYFPLRAFTTDD